MRGGRGASRRAPMTYPSRSVDQSPGDGPVDGDDSGKTGVARGQQRTSVEEGRADAERA